MHRVFLADQEARVVDSIAAGFAELGYSVEVVHDVASAIAAASSSGPNVALIARKRPMVCGPGVIRQLEEGSHSLPMLLITDTQTACAGSASSEGAVKRDPCKPFALAQIAARLRSQLVGAAPAWGPAVPAHALPRASTLRVADLEIERNARRVFRAGIPIEVTRREYVLLEYFALHSETTVTREMIAREVWQVENRATSLDNVIDVHIGRLRRKLAVAGGSSLIHTIRGVGYTLMAGEAFDAAASPG